MPDPTLPAGTTVAHPAARRDGEGYLRLDRSSPSRHADTVVVTFTQSNTE